MFIISPLEQFQIIALIPIQVFYVDYSVTNSSLFMILAAFLIIYFFQNAIKNAKIIPRRQQAFAEMIYEFVYNLLYENVGEKGNRYFPFMITLFLFILVCNLLGMIPYSFTVTSHIIVTFFLSLSIFIGITIIGFVHHGIHFFSFFLPPGAPIALAPFLVVIELISYVSRAFSLAIRLFANMMSGHSLLKILAGFSWTMLSIGGIFYVLHLIPLIIVFLITGLEIGIAALQAYVFTVLVCIYLNDSINLH
uniref:ATP synthase subunit a n=1 Tax=Malawimonas californiana TaxID=221722 RepID=A0A0B5GCP4_MALCL|nr:ATP synthase F0 subunit a [Malawimonas californiana]AJF22861.1 ATP synthase F0 subunit a [Malawimonas californiana]